MDRRSANSQHSCSTPAATTHSLWLSSLGSSWTSPLCTKFCRSFSCLQSLSSPSPHLFQLNLSAFASPQHHFVLSQCHYWQQPTGYWHHQPFSGTPCVCWCLTPSALSSQRHPAPQALRKFSLSLPWTLSLLCKTCNTGPPNQIRSLISRNSKVSMPE